MAASSLKNVGLSVMPQYAGRGKEREVRLRIRGSNQPVVWVRRLCSSVLSAACSRVTSEENPLR